MVVAYASDNVISTCSATTLRRDTVFRIISKNFVHFFCLQQTIPGITDTIVKLVSSSNYKSIAMLKDNGDVLIGLKENIGQAQSFTLKYSSNNDKIKITDIAWQEKSFEEKLLNIFIKRCGSDAVIGIRSSSKTWFDLLIINGKHSQQMTFVLIYSFYCYYSIIFLEKKADQQ